MILGIIRFFCFFDTLVWRRWKKKKSHQIAIKVWMYHILQCCKKEIRQRNLQSFLRKIENTWKWMMDMEETSTKSTFDSVILYTEINNQKWRVQWPSQKVVTNKGAFGHSLHGADKGFYHSESYKNPSKKNFHSTIVF